MATSCGSKIRSSATLLSNTRFVLTLVLTRRGGAEAAIAPNADAGIAPDAAGAASAPASGTTQVLTPDAVADAVSAAITATGGTLASRDGVTHAVP